MPRQVSIVDLSRRGLNDALMRCNDEAKLDGWMKDEVRAGRLYRAERVYRRYAAVRRVRELRGLKTAVLVNQITEVANDGRDTV